MQGDYNTQRKKSQESQLTILIYFTMLVLIQQLTVKQTHNIFAWGSLLVVS